MRGKERWVWSLAKAIASPVPVFKFIISQLFQKELKSLLMKVKEKREKAGLNIQKINFMASSPITSWQNRWGNHRHSERLYFLGLQNHCRW